jgi:membrane associated rhomboid family serine protease
MFIYDDEFDFKKRLPWVSLSLITINILVFLMQLALGDSFTNGFSVVPKEITTFKDLTKPEYVKVKMLVEDYDYYRDTVRLRVKEERVKVPQAQGPFPIFLTLFTSTYLHGGWVHLIGNMWFLFTFGLKLEQKVGHGLYLLLYTVCGVAASLAHVLVDPQSVIPCLGASGAISGIMGAYLFLFPLHKIKLWLGWLVGSIEVPAWGLLGVWFLLQYMSGLESISGNEMMHGGVAYWAHIGGFVMGLAFVSGLFVYLKIQHERSGPQPEVATDNNVPPPPDLAHLFPERHSDPLGDFLPSSDKQPNTPTKVPWP